MSIEELSIMPVQSIDTVIDIKDVRRPSRTPTIHTASTTTENVPPAGTARLPTPPKQVPPILSQPSTRSSRRGSVTGTKQYSSKEFEMYGYSLGTLKGPILQQSAVMYTFFIFLLISAQFLNWAPNIRFISGVPYVMVCIVIIEVSRLCTTLDSTTIHMLFPFYMSLAPFGLLCFFSREAHIITSILFFCCSLIIYLQSGVPALQVHVMIYILLFILEYAVIIIAMMLYYVDSTQISFSAGRILSPGIRWGEEITFLISLGLIGVAFLLMEKFVKLYASTLLDHSNNIKNLEHEKEQLLRELRAFKNTEEKVDLDAPIQKVIASLQDMMNNSPDMDAATKEQMQNVINILGSNQLYSVKLDFENKPQVDSEMSSFLHTLLEVAPEERKKKMDELRIGEALQQRHVKTTRFMPSLDSALAKQVDILLEKVDDWDFDIFQVAELTNNRPLFFVAYSLFQQHDLMRAFQIDDNNMRRFLAVIEEGYEASNPYHNAVHAADVLQTLNYMIVHGGLNKYMTQLDIFASLIAAIIHDYEHPGLNNAYQINTSSELAVRYNDRSVLENYHTASAFSIMYDEANNIMGGLSEGQRREFRETVVTMVLATDMAQHFELLSKFKSKLSGNEGFDPKDRKDRLMVLQIAIKCSDISNPSKNTYLCCQWAKHVMEEFYRQGDEETRKGLPVSAFMDRSKPSEPKCQIGFIDFIVAPIYETWAQFLPQMEIASKNLELNKQYWKKQLLMEENKQRNPSLETFVLDAKDDKK
eukprot:TRINITY_DN4328_c0_g1_i1.p1 TRINITY_DN4328_c0_g1~~TRINITY_DN4328_c0_g1_i1.p1  ORF type:complete len:758 (+),score=285.67 TRINITY_DN4328_c0_g1_i1:3227-5500(+)